VLLAGAVLLAVLFACGSSRAMLASARLSCIGIGHGLGLHFYDAILNVYSALKSGHRSQLIIYRTALYHKQNNEGKKQNKRA